MNVTGCVPLAGQGLIARRGRLVALTDGLTDGLDGGPDPLLATLAEVADANGDGTALALAGTRAALERGGRPAWASAGVTFGGEVTVLVHGEAAALVSAAGSPEAEVTASGSMIPVVRTFTGAAITVRLVVGVPAAPDPRLWLGEGTVSGGGILLTFAQEKSPGLLPDDRYSPAVPAVPAVPAAPPRVAPAAVPPEPAAVLPEQIADPPGYEPTMLAWPPAPAAPPAPPQPAAPPEARTPPARYTESWFSTGAPPSGPTLRTTRTDGAGLDGPAEPPIADIAAIELVRLAAVEPVVVDGAMCDRMHFNPPDARFCRECGISMPDATRNRRRQPRPPLGVLLVDDGRGYVLDRDYVIGREPLLDGDVAAGRATPLSLSDPESSVSRLHLRISLVGWQVEVRDLGSSNGSVLYRAGGPRTLAPMGAASLDPGARVGIGRRTVQFLPYRAASHGATLDGASA